MKLYLHIGTHKTGTTALQVLLAENYDKLLVQNILFPKSGRPWQRGGQHNIAWQLSNDSRFRSEFGTLKTLCDEIKNTPADNIIISSEDFECLYVKPRSLQIFKKHLDDIGCQVNIVIFLRERVSYSESLYKELLKHGLNISFAQYIKTVLEEGKFAFKDWTFCFEYEKIINGFEQIFDGKVYVKKWEEPIEKGFFSIFKEKIALPPSQNLNLSSYKECGMNKDIAEKISMRFAESQRWLKENHDITFS